jgi:hypothetical protein
VWRLRFEFDEGILLHLPLLLRRLRALVGYLRGRMGALWRWPFPLLGVGVGAGVGVDVVVDVVWLEWERGRIGCRGGSWPEVEPRERGGIPAGA